MIRQEDGDHVAEDQVEQRSHDRLGEHEAPGHKEAGDRVDATGAVRVQAPRRREVARQLSDADGDHQARHQSQHDCEGGCAAGVGDREDDGERHRRRRRHVGDGLEQDLCQADGVLLKPRCHVRLGSARHGAPPCRPCRVQCIVGLVGFSVGRYIFYAAALVSSLPM